MQLFSDERCQFGHGCILVQTEYPFYEPGQTVNGIVYMNTKEAILGVHGLELEIKGSSKNSFKQQGFAFEQGAKNAKMKMNKIKGAKRIIRTSQMIYFHDSDTELQAGDYIVRFSFSLPENLPSSLYFKSGKDFQDAPKAKVKYYCKARLVCDDEEKRMVFK